MSISNGNKEVTQLSAARQAMVPNPLKDKMLRGDLAHSCSLKMHGSFSLDSANQLSCAALLVGITPIIRVPANTSDWISRALDGGAQAVIVPHVQNAEEAANVVRFARFAPLGERSATGGMPIMRYASISPRYANQACNENITVICMVESTRAVDCVESIAAVPGVDVLLVGHGDLTQDMGIPGEFDDPRVGEAFAKVCAAAKKASIDGRKVFVGMGGLHTRPDLQQTLARKHPEARFAMSGADSGFLLAGMIGGGNVSQGVTAAVRS